jgi:hypothetical protein
MVPVKMNALIAKILIVRNAQLHLIWFVMNAGLMLDIIDSINIIRQEYAKFALINNTDKNPLVLANSVIRLA